MSWTLGKLMIDKGDVCNMMGEIDRLATSFTNYDGGFTQSLTDLLIVKMAEVVLEGVEVERVEGGKLFIPCTDEHGFWVEIIRTTSGYQIEIGEPAA